MALINKLPLQIDALSLLAEALNYDFASKPLDEPLTTEELKGMQGILGIRDGVLKNSGKANPSARDFVTFSGRGQVQDAIVGGPKEIADKLEEMFVERGWTALSSRPPSCRLLRRFRQACRAGIAAPRPVSQGLCRQDVA
jgi:alkanesulfonate monooxygenase SsuD/methylene tetrahydromethanopterin reductase-like flavin-dependent oxidoreductase (luciferase family)